MPEEKGELLHNVFISWSGERSKHAAQALRDWLPKVIQVAKPFMSDSDIDKGSRGLLVLANALEGTKVGIVCLTPENLSAPWLLFESGALSKTLDRGTRVCTYLLAGLKPSEVAPPLGQFQASTADKTETWRMLQDINKVLGTTVPEDNLTDIFDVMWPKLEEKLSSLPNPEAGLPPKRSHDDMIAEILENSRTIPQLREAIHEVGEITLKAAERLFYKEAIAAVRLQTLLERIGGPDYSDAVAGLGGGNLNFLRALEPKDKAKE